MKSVDALCAYLASIAGKEVATPPIEPGQVSNLVKNEVVSGTE